MTPYLFLSGGRDGQPGRRVDLGDFARLFASETENVEVLRVGRFERARLYVSAMMHRLVTRPRAIRPATVAYGTATFERA